MLLQQEIAKVALEILETPITDSSIQEIIDSKNITDIGMTSLNMVMFIVELEDKYNCRIDIADLSTKDINTIAGWCNLIQSIKS